MCRALPSPSSCRCSGMHPVGSLLVPRSRREGSRPSSSVQRTVGNHYLLRKHFAIDGTTALRISQTAREVAAKVLGESERKLPSRRNWLGASLK